MSKLNSAQRSNLPSTAFAIPSKMPGPGSYPIPDASHARNALSRVSANGSAAVKAKVKSAVKSKFPSIGAKAPQVNMKSMMEDEAKRRILKTGKSSL